MGCQGGCWHAARPSEWAPGLPHSAFGEPLVRRYRLLLLLGVTTGQSIAIGVGVVLVLSVVGEIDAAALRATVHLDPSSHAATLDECQRAAPELGRPSWSVSQRKFSNRAWTKRVCGW